MTDLQILLTLARELADTVRNEGKRTEAKPAVEGDLLNAIAAEAYRICDSVEIRNKHRRDERVELVQAIKTLTTAVTMLAERAEKSPGDGNIYHAAISYESVRLARRAAQAADLLIANDLVIV